MSDSLNAFGWRAWPFRVVADEESAKVWADRAQLRAELDRRLRKLKTVGHSTVQLMWADFGAGKTHTLRRFEALSLAEEDSQFIPIFTEIPVGTEGIIDLFRRLMAALPAGVLADCASQAQQQIGKPSETLGARDLRHALRLAASEDSGGRSIAAEWMQASPGLPHLKALKSYGIGSRIEDDARAVEVMSELFRLLRGSGSSKCVLWLIDEFQRVADIPPRRREAFGKSIVSLFNASSKGLHFVLSFSVAQQSTATALIPPDLRSRAATFPLLALGKLDPADSYIFAEELFAQFRLRRETSSAHPFSPVGLRAAVDAICTEAGGATTPRVLMERLESILFEFLETDSAAGSLPISDEMVARLNASIRARE